MPFRYALFWGCAALAAGAELLILRSAFSPPARARTEPAANAPALPRSPRSVEITWALLPPIALVAAFWAAWRALV